MRELQEKRIGPAVQTETSWRQQGALTGVLWTVYEMASVGRELAVTRPFLGSQSDTGPAVQGLTRALQCSLMAD